MKNSNSISGKIIPILCLALLSSPAFAGWDDDKESVFEKIDNLKTALDNVITQM
jgi:hypothetical protein